MPHAGRVVEGFEVPKQELLVVRDLDPHLRLEVPLQPGREQERDHVAEVHRARRPAARVQAEGVALLVLVEDPVQIAVGEVQTPLQ